LPVKRAAGERGAVASLLAGMGVCAQFKGDYATARKFYDESLTIRRELGDGLNIARTLIDFGTFASDQGEFAEATRLLDEALVLFRAAGRRMGLSLVLGSLALVAVRSGTPSHGELLAREAIQLAESVGFTESVRTAKIILCRALLALGDLDQADTLARAVGAVDEMAPALPGAIARLLAAVAFQRAQPRFAARLLGAASTDSAAVPPADRTSHDKLVGALSVSLGADFDAEYAFGRDRGGHAVLAASELRE
jgi:tetratricopeptide (TPR) repeat protein